MDPLSVTASVIGILTAAGKIASLLGSAASSWSEAPPLLRTTHEEICGVRRALECVSEYLDHAADAAPERRALIRLDDLVMTLTEGVLTFSELERLLGLDNKLADDNSNSPKETSFKERIFWVRHETAIERLVTQLQRHKSSLTLMLSILQW
jgi:hypothetical protein